MCVAAHERSDPCSLDSPTGMSGPMHKRTFTLKGGECLNDDAYSILTFDVRVEGSDILVLLPDENVLDELIGTSKWMVKQHTAEIVDGGLGDGIEVEGVTPSLCIPVAGGCSGDPRLDW